MIESISSHKFCELIFEQLQIGQAGRERRRVARFPWESPVAIELTGADEGGQVVPARALDISRVGCAVLCDQALPTGARVRIRADGVEGQPQVDGRTVSCLPYGDGVFRIGVQYADDPALI